MHTNEDVMNEKKWQAQNSAFKSPWVLGWIGMIVVVLTVNIAFVIISIKTAPDLTVQDYYERGKNYDDTLKRWAHEASLGWQGEIVKPAINEVNRPAEFRFRLAGADGVPLNADKVEFFAYRPSDAGADFSVVMARVEAGLYAGKITFSLPGTWDVIVSAEHVGERFETPTRLFIEKELSK